MERVKEYLSMNKDKGSFDIWMKFNSFYNFFINIHFYQLLSLLFFLESLYLVISKYLKF